MGGDIRPFTQWVSAITTLVPYWDALCSQHFEYGSNYGHVTFRIQKLTVEPEAVSQMKKVMIYGSLLVYLL